MKSGRKTQVLCRGISSKDNDVKKKAKKVSLLLGVISIYKVKYFYSGKNSEFVIAMNSPNIIIINMVFN